jgi:hypothetical protein
MGIMFCGCFSVFFIWWHFSRMPDPAHGYIYPLNDHGSDVYVTKAQFLAGEYSWPVVVLGFVLAILGRKARGKNFLGKWKD